nr:unnamed protein product [Digitaria exilis]
MQVGRLWTATTLAGACGSLQSAAYFCGIKRRPARAALRMLASTAKSSAKQENITGQAGNQGKKRRRTGSVSTVQQDAPQETNAHQNHELARDDDASTDLPDRIEGKEKSRHSPEPIGGGESEERERPCQASASSLLGGRAADCRGKSERQVAAEGNRPAEAEGEQPAVAGEWPAARWTATPWPLSPIRRKPLPRSPFVLCFTEDAAPPGPAIAGFDGLAVRVCLAGSRTNPRRLHP